MFAFPIIGALLVAISRTEDYRHHWHDVTIGAMLGTLCAYFAYRQYYPGLSQESCRDPFLNRVAHCRKGYDVESGVVITNNSNIALLSSDGQPKQYISDDHYSDASSGSQQNILDHSNSRIPLVGRN